MPKKPQITGICVTCALEKPIKLKGMCSRCYGISLYGENWWRRPKKPPEECKICGKTRRLVVDHDHNSTCRHERTKKRCPKCTRGRICVNCNAGLGFLGDDPSIVQEALRYLKEWIDELERRP